MPSEQRRAQRISGFSVHEALHQEKVKNPKLRGNMVIMLFIFLQELKNNTEL